jgi:hypothetical protein
MTIKTSAKSVLFKCGRCGRLITVFDPRLPTVYGGHFHCLRRRKAGGCRCANQQEEMALLSEHWPIRAGETDAEAGGTN